MPRGVGDDPGQRGGGYRQLGCYAAGPEYAYLAVPNSNRVSEIGLIQIADADFSRVSQVHGGAVGQVKAGGDLGGPDGLPRSHGAHGYHELR